MGREICCCEKIDDRKRMGRKNFIITSDKNFSLNIYGPGWSKCKNKKLAFLQNKIYLQNNKKQMVKL